MASAQEEQMLPPIQMLVRDHENVRFHEGKVAEFSTKESEAYPCTGPCMYSPNGQRIVMANKESVQVYDANTREVVQSFDLYDVENVAFSPLGNFLVTWQRKGGEKGGDGKGDNLFAFDVNTGKTVLSFKQKECKKESWPSIRWTDDEKLCAHMVVSEIRFYDGRAPGPQLTKLRLKNVAQFSFAPKRSPHRLATFLPAKAGVPAKVQVWEYPNLENSVATKSFFQADNCKIVWDPTGAAVLIQTSTDADSSGKSYYGETGLHMLNVDTQFSCVVPFGGNQGPIEDVAWAPSGENFIAIQGKQPQQATLFTANDCTPKCQFGNAPRNTIAWQPQGRFVFLGGFGNLAGGMEFWDRFKFAKMGVGIYRDGVKNIAWTPCGRYLVASVLRPWRRVDNGFKIFDYSGEEVYSEKIDKLHQVLVRPTAPDVYPNRPMSPRVRKKVKDLKSGAAAAAAPKAYVPPRLRGKVGATNRAAAGMRKEVVGPRKLHQTQQQKLGVAQSKPDDGLSKSQRKKLRQKAAQAKREADAEALKKAEEMRVAAELQAKRDAMSPAQKLQKEIKKLKKKLTAIEKIKKLPEHDQAQRTKLATEPDLLAKVAELTKKLEAL